MRENYNIEPEENETHEDESSWFQKGILNEILFMDEFLELFPMKNFEGNFYGPDGMIAASTVEHNIYRLLSTQAYSGLANKTKNLFKALQKMQSVLLFVQVKVCSASYTFNTES